MNYYCFPDIHGCYTLLAKALQFVYEKNPSGGKIIFLGDYIDRGSDNLKVLETVMNPPENWEFICLMGNHEQMFLESYYHRDKFYDSKAAQDIAGLKEDKYITYDQVWRGIPQEILAWLDNLKLVHIEDRNVFAHAFYDDTRKPEEQIPSDCVWTRMDDWMTFQNSNQGLYLTHGHTPRKHGPIKSPNRVNLDAGAVFYGRYVIGEYQQSNIGPTNFYEFTDNKE
jgi:serine/threonine protein phosphatase 1